MKRKTTKKNASRKVPKHRNRYPKGWDAQSIKAQNISTPTPSIAAAEPKSECTVAKSVVANLFKPKPRL